MDAVAGLPMVPLTIDKDLHFRRASLGTGKSFSILKVLSDIHARHALVRGLAKGEYLPQDNTKTPNYIISVTKHKQLYTGELLNKGHIGTSHFVHYREVVLFLMYSGTSE